MATWIGISGAGSFRRQDEPAPDDRWAIKAATRLAKGLSPSAGVPLVYGVGPSCAQLVEELATGSISRMESQHLCIGLPAPKRPYRKPKRAGPHDFNWPQQPVWPVSKVWIILGFFETDFRVMHSITEAWLARDVPVHIVGLCYPATTGEYEAMVDQILQIHEDRSSRELCFKIIHPDRVVHAPWRILRLLLSDAKAQPGSAEK